jgi:hypothetical protein
LDFHGFLRLLALTPSLSLLAQLCAAAPPPTSELKVLVLNFDPVVEPASGKRLHQEFRWNDPRKLAEEHAADVNEASGGRIEFKIVEWIDLDEFPVKVDGFAYTLPQFLETWRAKKGFHQPDQADYPKLIAENRLVEKVESGEIDETWWFGFPYCGFGESAMAGRGAFGINGPSFDAPKVKCKRPFAIMGFNYERGPAEMIHNLCHRTEATMSRIFGGWQTDRLDHDWARFAANAHQSNGVAAAGTCHYPPNAVKDYDYANKDFVESSADDWKTYPKLTGAKMQVNCENWGGPDYQRNYLKWWFARLPRTPGVNPESGRLNDWWEYVYGFHKYDARGQAQIPVDARRERDTATAVLAIGGRVVLLTGDGRRELRAASDLTQEDFELTDVDLSGRELNEDVLDKIAGSPRLRWLNLGGAPVSDGALARLGRLPALEWLSLTNTRVTDAGIRTLDGFPQLAYLEANRIPLTDAALGGISSITTLRELHLSNTKVTDAGLLQVRKLTRLKTVSVEGTAVTDLGVARLREILPGVEIRK